MRGEHVFITIIGDEVIGYGNLKILTKTIGSFQKYSSIGRKLSKEGRALVDGVMIKKIPVVRGTKNG